MIKQADDIANDLLALPLKVRASLARSLIASLDSEVERGAEKAWEKEISRRYKLFKQGKSKGRPVAQVLADLRAKLK